MPTILKYWRVTPDRCKAMTAFIDDVFDKKLPFDKASAILSEMLDEKIPEKDLKSNEKRWAATKERRTAISAWVETKFTTMSVTTAEIVVRKMLNELKE